MISGSLSLTNQQKTHFENTSLILLLEKYVNKSDLKGNKYSFFGYTKQDQFAAVEAFKKSINEHSFIEEKHIAVLLDGELKKTINKYLEIYKPGMTPDELFSEARQAPSDPVLNNRMRRSNC